MHEGQKIPLDGESILARLTELVGVPGHERERAELSEAWAALEKLPPTPALLSGRDDFREPVDDRADAQVEPAIPAVSIEHLQRAFDAGREQGRAEGQRELLQWLFAGATTGQQIVDRAAVRAFAATWPEGEPCPLTVADLAALVGVSPRTAARRKADAQNGRWFSR